MQSFSFLEAIVLFTIVLKCSLPVDSRIPHQMFLQTCAVIFGQFWLEVLKIFPNDNPVFELVYLCVILPCVREAIRALTTRSTWYLSYDAQVAGTGIRPARQHAWVFAAWVQVLFATYYRFIIANTTDPALAFVVIAWQAFLEVALRLTVQQRDAWLKKTAARYFCGRGKLRRRGTTVVPSHAACTSSFASFPPKSVHVVLGLGTITEQSAIMAIAERAEARASFYSTLLLTDMIAEYVGILTTLVFIAFKSDNVLSASFPWYTSQPLDQPQALAPLFKNSLLQFVMELVVDVLCVYLERGTDPTVAWNTAKANKVSFLTLLTLCIQTGSVIGRAVVQLSDNVDGCAGQDMCNCVNNGLVIGGVKDTYCKLIYANTSGVPPSS